MKRLYLTVEGQTEAAFAKEVLTPHLSHFSVFLMPPRFTGPHRRQKGHIPRGGMLNTFGHAMADIKTWLKEDQSSDARFSIMIDLYGLPQDFPGYQQGMAKPPGREQARGLENSLKQEIGDSRFIPYLQLHEFEALVLVDPRKIQLLYDVPNSVIEALISDCNIFETPEQINHGQHSHPKSRILSRVPKYDANISGPMITQDIGLPTLRARCPHFGEWLNTLEQLDA